MCTAVTRAKPATCNPAPFAVDQVGVEIALELITELQAAGTRYGNVTARAYFDQSASDTFEQLGTHTDHSRCSSPLKCIHTYDQMQAALQHGHALVVAYADIVLDCDHAWLCPSPLPVQP